MPKGPKGEKRPADVIGAAIKVARIATGEELEDYGADEGKDARAVSLGRKFGKARAEALSPKRRSQIVFELFERMRISPRLFEPGQ